jgi:hypothetical protein
VPSRQFISPIASRANDCLFIFSLLEIAGAERLLMLSNPEKRRYRYLQHEWAVVVLPQESAKAESGRRDPASPGKHKGAKKREAVVAGKALRNRTPVGPAWQLRHSHSWKYSSLSVRARTAGRKEDDAWA